MLVPEVEEMSHLAPRSGMLLAVKMETDIGIHQEVFPMRVAVLPEISKEIHHQDGLKKGRVPQR